MKPASATRYLSLTLFVAYLLLALEVLVIPGRGWAFYGAAALFVLAATLAFGPFPAFRSPTGSTERGLPSTRWRWPLVSALLASSLFLQVGWTTLSVSHPHEDAYILFRYVEHIAGGQGIVYNPGGPRTEGATDFLWLLSLSAVTWLGGDVAVGALVLNGLGAGLAAFLLTRVVAEEPRCRRLVWAAALVFPLVVVLNHGAAASYVGFGTIAYSAVALLLVYLGLGPSRVLVWLPVVGLIAGLFRPDGVVLGVAFALVGLWRVRGRPEARRYGQALVGCAVLGIVYFAWRYAYFGLPLPLPLYVKGQTAWLDLPGAHEGLRWLGLRMSPLPALAGCGLLAALLVRQRGVDVGRAALCLVPPLLLWAAFLFAWPLQNFAWRFQAPVSFAVVMVFTQLAVWMVVPLRDQGRQLTVLALLFLATALTLQDGSRWVRDLFRGDTFRSYHETFAPLFGEHFDGSQPVIALTEAGRLPYWFDGDVVDVVGLNNPTAALRPLTREDLDRLDPDIIMFHHARTMNLRGSRTRTDAPLIRRLDRVDLAAAIRPSFVDVFRDGLRRYEETSISRNEVAAVLLARYLVNRGGFDIVATDHRGNGTYRHVWGFRKGWPHTGSLIELMEAAGQPGGYRSYLDARRLQARSTPTP